MNKVFSKVAVATLISAVAVTAMQAGTPSKLYINSGTALYNDANGSTIAAAATPILGHNVDGNKSHAISIDILGQGTPSQLVFSPFVNLTSGSKFTLQAINAEFALAREASLCHGREVIGKLVSVGPSTATPAATMNNMSFRIIDSASDVFKKNNFAKDGNYTFAAANTCHDGTNGMPPLSLTSSGDACLVVSVRIPTSIDDSSQAFEDYTTAAVEIGETKRFVSIACAVPVCSIDINDDMKSFTTTATPSGINGDTRSSVSTDLAALRNSGEYCADCEDSATTCITTITVRNAAGADFNVTKLTFTPTFTGGGNAGMTYVVDGNSSGSIKGSLGSVITLMDFNLSANTEKNVTLTYTPTTSSVIAEGNVSATLVLGATKGSTKDLSLTVSPKYDAIATFKVAGQTAFTVPYMNSNNHGFVKITTLSDKGAQLSVKITDQDGKSTMKVLADIPNNGTVYLFSDSGALKDAADAAGLANAWTVDFETSAAATVVSYMPTKDGERTILAY